MYQSLEEMDRDKEKWKILIGIGERCFIKCALVDKDHCIGMMFILMEDRILNFANALYVIKDGIAVIKSAVILTYRIE
jgi:glucose-1-phosphate adenylyltransferase